MSSDAKTKRGMVFQDRVVVITGGAQGIGRCCVECFEREGAVIHVIDRKEGPWFVGGLAPHMEEYLCVLLEDDIPQAYGISGSGVLEAVR